MHPRFRVGAAAAAVLLLVAACGSSASTPTPAPTPAPTPTPAASSAAALPAGSFGLPDMHQAPDLEAEIPGDVNGVTLTKLSFNGAGMASLGGSSEEFMAVLGTLGKTPADFTAAVATDMGTSSLDVSAIRIAGVDANALYQAFAADVKKNTPNVQLSQVSLGGKTVTKGVDPSDTSGGAQYVYTKGDTLFVVSTTDEGLATAALQKLP